MTYQVRKVVQQAYDTIVSPDNENQLLFQHTVLCQVYLPYRDPGMEVRIWERQQGKARFAIQTTQVFNPKTNRHDLVLGLPFGTKARLVLTHINTLALQQQTPRIEVGESLTSFVKSMGLSTNGRQIESIKNQLARLAGSMMSIAFSPDIQPADYQKTLNFKDSIITLFDLYFPKNPNQRVMWDSSITLSENYFSSLMKHAVPLDKRHIAALNNNALALDTYTWLAQRLHRVNPGKEEFVHWAGLKEQFGEGYDRIDNFKRVFRKTLSLVLTQYRAAKIKELTNKGFYLYNSPTPVPPKTVAISGLKLISS